VPWFDKLRKGLEEVVGQVDGARAEIVAQQCYRAGRAACESGFRERSAADAVKDLEEAVKADAHFQPDANRWLAKACEAMGWLDRSQQCYLAAIDAIEQDDTNRLLAWVAGEYDGDPEDYLSELHDDLAVLLAGQSRHDEAIYHARRAVETNRDNLNAYHTLIASLHATGDDREVRRWLLQARDRDTLGLVSGWVAELGLDESLSPPVAGGSPLSQLGCIELPGLEVEDDDG
jgi:tetratricopeptide (TPR) repeat protein